MGYDVTPNTTRDALIRQLVDEYSPVDTEQRQDSLWAVVYDLTPRMREELVIVCFRLKEFPEGWGHKRIDEREFPAYFDCPLRMLERAAPTCSRWRRKVHRFQWARSTEKHGELVQETFQYLQSEGVKP